MYLLTQGGTLRVGSSPSPGYSGPQVYTYDNTTLYQSAYDNSVEDLSSATTLMAIRDQTLELNANHDSTAFLTAQYIYAKAYLENDELEPYLYDGGGTAWNLCVWEGCPRYSSSSGGSTGKITCAFGQSKAFRQFIPFFNDMGKLINLQMNWIQSNNLLMC